MNYVDQRIQHPKREEISNQHREHVRLKWQIIGGLANRMGLANIKGLANKRGLLPGTERRIAELC